MVPERKHQLLPLAILRCQPGHMDFSVQVFHINVANSQDISMGIKRGSFVL